LHVPARLTKGLSRKPGWSWGDLKGWKTGL